MKHLTLIRHAKSSWSEPGLTDFQRPLNKRGKRDAPFMGKLLAEAGLEPDVVLSSPAVRAVTTARQIARELGFPEDDIQLEKAIYDAHTDTLLEIVRQLEDEHEHALLFGHNPGFEDLANVLLDEPLDRLVTCGVVRMRLDAETWRGVGAGCGHLIEHLYPKLYR